MRVLEGDKEALRNTVLEKRQRLQGSKATERHNAGRLSADGTNGSSQAGPGGLPPLRFGTVNDPIPNGPDVQAIDGSKAAGWTTINAPVCTIYAGQMPYLSPDLLQFPIADSDGSIVVSILPVVSTGVLLGVSGQLQFRTT